MKKLSKSDFKTTKRIFRVLKAIMQIEQNTMQLTDAFGQILYTLEQTQQVAEGQQIPLRQGTPKKKMEEFRENWLDKQEVMQLMPVSERSLYALRKEGKLPSYQFKGKIYFKLQDIENLMRSKAS